MRIQHNEQSLNICYESIIAFGQKFQGGFLIDICLVCVVNIEHNAGWLSGIGFASDAGGRGSNPDVKTGSNSSTPKHSTLEVKVKRCSDETLKTRSHISQ